MYKVQEYNIKSKCPVCGHTVVQLTRIDNKDNISVIRKINKKAREFLDAWKDTCTPDEIKEAYEKTVDNTGKISFAYMNNLKIEILYSILEILTEFIECHFYIIP